MGGGFETYRDLRVWEEGIRLAEVCYRVARTFPREEIYGMTSQVRRSATSIPANIAEEYGRESSGEFVRFLRVAQGSLKELETHVILASRVGFIEARQTTTILNQCEVVGEMLRSLIRSVQNKSR